MTSRKLYVNFSILAFYWGALILIIALCVLQAALYDFDFGTLGAILGVAGILIWDSRKPLVRLFEDRIEFRNSLVGPFRKPWYSRIEAVDASGIRRLVITVNRDKGAVKRSIPIKMLESEDAQGLVSFMKASMDEKKRLLARLPGKSRRSKEGSGMPGLPPSSDIMCKQCLVKVPPTPVRTCPKCGTSIN